MMQVRRCYIGIWVLAVALIVSLCPGSFAQGRSSLRSLDRYVGRYPSQVHLWTSPPLHQRLRTLLKSDYSILVHNMEVENPIQRENGLLVTVGNKTHDGADNDACLIVDTHGNIINVLLNINHHLHVFAEHGTRLSQPPSVKEWIKTVTG